MCCDICHKSPLWIYQDGTLVKKIESGSRWQTRILILLLGFLLWRQPWREVRAGGKCLMGVQAVPWAWRWHPHLQLGEIRERTGEKNKTDPSASLSTRARPAKEEMSCGRNITCIRGGRVLLTDNQGLFYITKIIMERKCNCLSLVFLPIEGEGREGSLSVSH